MEIFMMTSCQYVSFDGVITPLIMFGGLKLIPLLTLS